MLRSWILKHCCTLCFMVLVNISRKISLVLWIPLPALGCGVVSHRMGHGDGPQLEKSLSLWAKVGLKSIHSSTGAAAIWISQNNSFVFDFCFWDEIFDKMLRFCVFDEICFVRFVYFDLFIVLKLKLSLVIRALALLRYFSRGHSRGVWSDDNFS